MKNKALIAVVIAAMIAGLGGIFIKHIHMSPTAIAWMRTTIPTIFLGGLLIYEGKPLFKRGLGKLAWLSIMSSLRIYLFILAYVLTSVGNAVVLFYTYPIFTLLVGSYLLNEKISSRQVWLMLLAFLGLIIIYSDKSFSFANKDFLGMLTALAAALIFAYVVVLMKKTNKDFSGNEVLFYQNFSGMLLFLPFFLADINSITVPNLAIGLVYGISIGVIVFSLFLYGLKSMKASITSSLMYLEIPSTMILGYLILDEKIGWNVFVGGLFIVLSSFLIRPRMSK